MPKPDFNAARTFAVDQLDHHLPSIITYHSSKHTLEEVVPAVDRMIVAEQIDREEDQLILRTAALFHDLGYTSAHLDHEEVSVRIAAEVLPKLGYSTHQIKAIQAMILATRLPQSPHGILAKILADADLDILGSEDFFVRNEDLRNEMEALYGTKKEVDWLASQIKFLETHHYFTRSTREVRDPGKRHHLEELQRRLNEVQAAIDLTENAD